MRPFPRQWLFLWAIPIWGTQSRWATRAPPRASSFQAPQTLQALLQSYSCSRWLTERMMSSHLLPRGAQGLWSLPQKSEMADRRAARATTAQLFLSPLLAQRQAIAPAQGCARELERSKHSGMLHTLSLLLATSTQLPPQHEFFAAVFLKHPDLPPALCRACRRPPERIWIVAKH